MKIPIDTISEEVGTGKKISLHNITFSGFILLKDPIRPDVKKSIAAGAGFALGASSSLSIASSDKDDFIYKRKIYGDLYKPNETSFCQFDNKDLLAVIEKHAAELGCKVYHGEPGSPDILAIPYFVAIVDRNIVGEETWDCYSDYCNEVNNKIPCIIVDDLDMGGLPTGKWWGQFFVVDNNMITSRISEIYKQIRNMERGQISINL